MAKETKILQIKRGSTADWANEAAPLRSGELGYDTTTKEMRCGDGTTAFPSLPALGAGGGGGGGTGDVESFSGTEYYFVGAGGDYATINEALVNLSKRHISYPADFDPDETGYVSAPTVLLMLMPGYVITEPIVCNGINLSWITIASLEQSTSEEVCLVDVDSDAIRGIITEGEKAVFIAMNGGVCPKVGFGFQMVGEDQYASHNAVGGFLATSGGRIFVSWDFYNNWDNYQIKDCEGTALRASEGGAIFADSMCIYGCKGYDAVNATMFGKVDAGYGTVSGCAQTCVMADQGGVVNVGGAVLQTNSTSPYDYCVNASAGGMVIFRDGEAEYGSGSPGANDINVISGGIVIASGATGGTSQTPNTITAEGIIFK